MSPPCAARPRRIPDAIPDAPVYRATLAEMDDLVELLARAEALASRYGAVRIDPPPEWTPPPLRMSRASRFFVRSQTLPEAPFVDTTPPPDDPLPTPDPPAKKVKTAAPHHQRQPNAARPPRKPRDDVAEVHGRTGRRRRVVNYAEDDDDDHSDAPNRPDHVIDLDDPDPVINLDDDSDDHPDDDHPNPKHPEVQVVEPTPPPAPQPDKKSLPSTETTSEHPTEPTRLPSTDTNSQPQPGESQAPPPPASQPMTPSATQPPQPPASQLPPPPPRMSTSLPPTSAPSPSVPPARVMLRSVLPTPLPPTNPPPKLGLPTAVESLPRVPRSKPQPRPGEVQKPSAAFTYAPRQAPGVERTNVSDVVGTDRSRQVERRIQPAPPAAVAPFSAGTPQPAASQCQHTPAASTSPAAPPVSASPPTPAASMSQTAPAASMSQPAPAASTSPLAPAASPPLPTPAARTSQTAPAASTSQLSPAACTSQRAQAASQSPLWPAPNPSQPLPSAPNDPLEKTGGHPRLTKPDVVMTPAEAANAGTVKKPAQAPSAQHSLGLSDGKAGISAPVPSLAEPNAIRATPTPLRTASAPQSQPPSAREQVIPPAKLPSDSDGSEMRPRVQPMAASMRNGFAAVQPVQQEQTLALRASVVPPHSHANNAVQVRSQVLPTRNEQNAARSMPISCFPTPQQSVQRQMAAAGHHFAIAPKPTWSHRPSSSGAAGLRLSPEQVDFLRQKHGMVVGQAHVLNPLAEGQKVRSPTGLQSACLPVRSPSVQMQSNPALQSSGSSPPLSTASASTLPPTSQSLQRLQNLPTLPASNNGQLPGVRRGIAVQGPEASTGAQVHAGFNRGSLSAILNHESANSTSGWDGRPSRQVQNSFSDLQRPQLVQKPGTSPLSVPRKVAGKIEEGNRWPDSRQVTPVESKDVNAYASPIQALRDLSSPARARVVPEPPLQLSAEEIMAVARESTQQATEQIQKLEQLSHGSSTQVTAVVPGAEAVPGGSAMAPGAVPNSTRPQSAGAPPAEAGVNDRPREATPHSTSDKVLPSECGPQRIGVCGEKQTGQVGCSAVEETDLQATEAVGESRMVHDTSPSGDELAKCSFDTQTPYMRAQSATRKEEHSVVLNPIRAPHETRGLDHSNMAVNIKAEASVEADHAGPAKSDQVKPIDLEPACNAVGPIQSSDALGNEMSTEPVAKESRAVKRPNKRKRNHVSYMKWGQDASGRLTEPPGFQDSLHPISLDAYEKRAIAFSERMRSTLLEDSRVNADVMDIIAENTDEDWMRNPDVLEGLFWEILHKGVTGKAITVNYGVDVEAEGAYKGESYVEWYGMDKTGRMVKQERKPVPAAGDSVTPKTEGQEVTARANLGKMGGRSVGHGVRATAVDLRGDVEDFSGDWGHVHVDKRRRKEPGKGKKRKNPSRVIAECGPKQHVGNLNKNGLLRHVPRMPGVNHSMFYIGLLFTRFCWHTEDAFLNSVSYLHHGSADKIWYAVPPKFAPAFETYAAEQVYSKQTAKDAASAHFALMSKTTIFDPREVRRGGIEVYRIRHKPGSFVLTAPRAYHAGFNCGFNIAEAVNFASPSWFPVGRVAASCARRGAYTLVVPYEYLLFHEAKSLRDTFPASRRPQEASPRVVTNARILATELDAVIQEGEGRIREYAIASNCRIAMLNDVDGLVKNNQLGPEFGPGAGMVCTVCKHACHFYAEICGSCADNREARCVAHFGIEFRSGLRRCADMGHKPVVVRRHDPIFLIDILTRLEEIAGMRSGPEKTLERYKGFLRPWETPLKSSGLRLKLNLKVAASRTPPTVLKDKRKRSGKRSALSRKRDLDEDPDLAQKKRRRKSDGGRKCDGVRKKDDSRKANRGKKAEPVVASADEFIPQVEVVTQSELVQPVDRGDGSHQQKDLAMLSADYLEVPRK